MKNTLENEMLDAAISWCDSNGINVLEPEQLSSLVNSLCITVRDAALDTAQPVQVNEWKDAVTDALVVAHILTTENAIYPRKAVQDVIDWNCQVALDPRVSSKAQALVDSGKSVQVSAMLVEALQAAEKLEHEALVALSEATYELKVGNTYTTATDTYKANNDLIHRLDKILNSQYRDRKRTALTAAKQAQPVFPFVPWSKEKEMVESWTAQQAQPELAPLICTWTQEDDFDMPGVYHTSCGEMWSFTEGGIKENNTKFCPHCGGGIKQGGQR